MNSDAALTDPGSIRAYLTAVGNVTLDENYLNALNDGTELLLTGRLDPPGGLDNDLLAQ
jgi:hypothetical protein